TTAPPPAHYGAVEGALASGFATAELHHLWGHDQRVSSDDIARRFGASPALVDYRLKRLVSGGIMWERRSHWRVGCPTLSDPKIMSAVPEA
ncbi:winged helix-turn-helix domain-containing protein, partial [Sinorhizobium meliloti]